MMTFDYHHKLDGQADCLRVLFYYFLLSLNRIVMYCFVYTLVHREI
jgi:hypothetical protein